MQKQYYYVITFAFGIFEIENEPSCLMYIINRYLCKFGESVTITSSRYRNTIRHRNRYVRYACYNCIIDMAEVDRKYYNLLSLMNVSENIPKWNVLNEQRRKKNRSGITLTGSQKRPPRPCCSTRKKMGVAAPMGRESLMGRAWYMTIVRKLPL